MYQRNIISLPLLLCILFNAYGQEELEVEGKAIFKQANRIATFESSTRNSFINLANNSDPESYTNIGWFNDLSSNDKYFYIDVGTGDFGEFRIHATDGRVTVGDPSFSSGAKFGVRGSHGHSTLGTTLEFGPPQLYISAFSAGGGGGGLLPNNGSAIVAHSWDGYGIYAESQDNIGIYGSGGFDSDANMVQPDFWASRGNYGGPSSIRWKKNIKPLDNTLDKITKIRGVSFTWDENHGGKYGIGFIAEEVGELFPEVVYYEKNGVDARGMDYSKISPILVEAIKEMRDEYQKGYEQLIKLIESQQKEIQLLQERLNLRNQ